MSESRRFKDQMKLLDYEKDCVERRFGKPITAGFLRELVRGPEEDWFDLAELLPGLFFMKRYVRLVLLAATCIRRILLMPQGKEEVCKVFVFSADDKVVWVLEGLPKNAYPRLIGALKRAEKKYEQQNPLRI
jgi:hypothetical protein